MFKYAIIFAALFASLPVFAADNEELRVMREQLQQLETRVQQAEPSARPVAKESSFNPAISLILAGTYGQFKQDAATPPTGFAMAAHTPPEQGFNLGESELGIMANIDPDFRGTATMSLSPAGGISVENAFVESLGMGSGFNLKFGRYFSGLGYLNEQHAHAWDFVDQPLVYRSLWNNQLGEDGAQLKWLVPSDTFVEIGAELAKGRGFPGTDTAKNGSGAGVLFAHIGDDIGTDQSWRIGASLHQTQRVNAESKNVPNLPGTANGVTDSFSGDSKTTGVDFIWKYAPNGNIKETNLKLQGEYFRRTENGLLTYDSTASKIADSYAVTQSGWYVQSVYQFMPRWRAGLRYDQLDSGVVQVGALNVANVIGNYAYTPKRSTLMLDFSPSEFSRLRVQVANDESRQGLQDSQLFVQYLMSLGAHGAHKF